MTFTTSSSVPGGAPSASSAAAEAGPVLSALKLSPARFRRGKHAAKLASHSHRRKPATPTATTISFRLSTAATVILSFQRAQPGQLNGHSCLAISAKRHHSRRCTRHPPVSGAVTLTGHAGANRISFEGILDGARKLPAGSYQLTLAARNAAGSTTALQHPTFTLLG